MAAMLGGGLNLSVPAYREPKRPKTPEELTDQDRLCLEKARIRREKKEARKAAQKKKSS